MDTTRHDLKALFAQLGLAHDADAIAAFIDQHRPLDPSLTLAEAPFWQPAQREFLLEAFPDDSDWVEAVDKLDAMLRHRVRHD